MFIYLIVPLSHSQVTSELINLLLLQSIVCIESSVVTKPLRRETDL